MSAGAVIERWVVERPLGRGGMAEVWRVRHRDLGTVGALKLLTLPREDLQERLLREGRVQAQLVHPNVVRVHDVLRLDGRVALVLDYVRGTSLDAIVASRRMTVEQVDELARGMLEGMAVAHRTGLVHRDIKPGNVLLDASGSTLVPRVADFGLARALDDTQPGPRTRTGVSMGTPGYMPPEQIRDARRADQRADVFSLGVVLYEMLSGHMPYPGEDLIELFEAMTHERREPIPGRRVDVPERMLAAIDAALRPNPEDRPADAGQLLSLWVGSPPTPPPVGAWPVDVVAALRGDDASVPAPTPGTMAPSSDGIALPTPTPLSDPGSDFMSPAPRVWPLAIAGAITLVGLCGGLGATAVIVGGWPDGTVAASDEPPSEPVVPVVPVVETALAAAPAAVATVDPKGARESSPAPRKSPPRAEPARAEPRGEPAAPETKVVVVPADPPGRAEPEVAPAPSVPSDDVANTPRTTATVRVEGVARARLLDRDGVARDPGEVPPGRYTLTVFFDPTVPTEVLTLDLAAGDVRSIRCVPAARMCK